VDGYEPCAYEAAAKIHTMIIAEEPEYAKEWVTLLVGAVNQKGSVGTQIRISDPMIMPIFVYLLKHERLAIHFLESGGIRIF